MNGKGSNWGLKGYEVPKKNYDHIQMKRDKENYKIAINKKKAPKPSKINRNQKRGDFLDHVIKKT